MQKSVSGSVSGDPRQWAPICPGDVCKAEQHGCASSGVHTYQGVDDGPILPLVRVLGLQGSNQESRWLLFQHLQHGPWSS